MTRRHRVVAVFSTALVLVVTLIACNPAFESAAALSIEDDGNHVTVSWPSALAYGEGTTIESYQMNLDGVEIARMPADVLSCTLQGLASSSEYQISVAAFDSEGRWSGNAKDNAFLTAVITTPDNGAVETEPTCIPGVGTPTSTTAAVSTTASTTTTTTAPPPPEHQYGSTLGRGEALIAGYRLTASDGSHQLVMQHDGNLVLYRTSGMTALWSTGTSGAGDRATFEFQGDGNAVLYSASRQALWSTATLGTGSSYVGIQPDGNLVVGLPDGRPAWHRGGGLTGNTIATLGAGFNLNNGMGLTSTDGGYSLVMQGDGNLVVYRSGGVATWSTGTAGHGDSVYAAMQPDGNLVLYRPGHGAIWNSGTPGSGGIRLSLQPDGNLVIANGQGAPVWSWMTGRVGGQTSTPPGDDYPYRDTPLAQRACCYPDPWGAFKWECTSFVAWRLRSAGATDVFNWGNGGQWAQTAQNRGYAVNTSPALGAVAQWNNNEMGGGYGHVAIVQEVLPDGSVYVEEYNYVAKQYSRRGPLRAPRYLHVRDRG